MVNMAALPDLVTVAQFRQLPEGGEFVHELHHGEVVSMTRPRARHLELKHRLMRQLAPKLAGFGVVRIEYPFRPLAEFDLRAADVAAVARGRWEAIDPDDNLRGAPELAIEVKSPSNTRRQLQELVALCLANGSLECWVLSTDKKSVSVVRREGSAVLYAGGDAIPLAAFGAGELTVDEIFG
jgi:Uma2 family endonuclease